MANSIGKTVGGVLLIGGTVAIWLLPEADAPKPEPEPLRPVRSAVVRDAGTMPDLKFSGIVKAGADRTLSFKHPGRVERIPVAKGQQVKKGEKLAWLVQDDFKNRLDEAEAALERDRLTYGRMSKAAAHNAVSQEELSKAASALRRSEAQYATTKLTLEDSTLYAPFDSIVADVPGEELQMVGAADKIVVLLDLTTIKIDAAVPESVIIMQRRLTCRKGNAPVTVTFDSANDRSYPVTFVEYKTMAERDNQTFTATYRLPAPADLVLLPGMSATITVPGSAYCLAAGSRGSVEIPASAAGVAADGGYFAWRLDPCGDAPGVFEARRRRLDGCAHVAGVLRVASGLSAGDRVATAGVAVLTEGRRVTLAEDVSR